MVRKKIEKKMYVCGEEGREGRMLLDKKKRKKSRGRGKNKCLLELNIKRAGGYVREKGDEMKVNILKKQMLRTTHLELKVKTNRNEKKIHFKN